MLRRIVCKYISNQTGFSKLVDGTMNETMYKNTYVYTWSPYWTGVL